METPLITFAIPAYSRPELLAAALASIAGQTEKIEYEVVICDDGPRELGAEAQAAAFPGGRCRYFRNEPPLGAVQNWNRCLSEARGEWVTVLHEDDLLYPWYLSLVLPRLTPTLAAVAVQTDQGDQPPATEAPPSSASASPPVWRYPPRYFIKSAMSPFPGVLLRGALVRQLGGFDVKWGPLADYEFWYRVACAGPIDVVRARGAFYRVSPGQWTERAWTRMLRLTHLMRLRMVQEQFADSPRFGLWLARFFTYRNALSYSRRFAERPAALGRALSLRRISGSWLPSGWVWQLLKARTAGQTADTGGASTELVMQPNPKVLDTRQKPPGSPDSKVDRTTLRFAVKRVGDNALHPLQTSQPLTPTPPPAATFLTVAIPTYNRASRLRETLAGIALQDYSADRFEILVIDNNSTDETAAVVAEFGRQTPAPRYLREARQGLDYARNRAIVEAQGDIIIFADDDILVESNWLTELTRPFATDDSGEVAAVGGEVIPVFPDGLPAWVAEWHSPLAFRPDAGPLPAHQSPMGANLAIRRSVFTALGLFHTALDRAAGNYFSGGDAEMIRRIRAGGLAVWFAPAAAVRHQMPASRTTFRYASRHAFDSARSRVIDRAGQPGGGGYLASRFAANLFKALGCGLSAILWFALGQAGRAKKALVRGWRCCGYLYQIPRSACGKI